VTFFAVDIGAMDDFPDRDVIRFQRVACSPTLVPRIATATFKKLSRNRSCHLFGIKKMSGKLESLESHSK
jgi:hypothetical protein